MRVSSPVGEFPFSIERFALRRGTLEISGHMGRWPAKVEIEPRDLLQPSPAIAGAAALGLGLGVASVALGAIVLWGAGRRSGRRGSVGSRC